MVASFCSLAASSEIGVATSRQVHNEAGRKLDVSRLCASAASCPTRSEHARNRPDAEMLANTSGPTLPTELIFHIVGYSFGQHYYELVASPKSIPTGWEPGSVFMQTSRTFRVCTRRFLKPLWGKQVKQGARCNYKKTMALLRRLADHVYGELDDLVKEDQPPWLKEHILRSPSIPLVFILKGLFCYTARSRIWPSESHWEKWEAHVPPMLEHTNVMLRMAESYERLPIHAKATALGPLNGHIRDIAAPWTVAFTRAYILRHLVETLISQFVKKGDLPQDVYILTMVDALDEKSLEHSKLLAREVKASCDTDMRMLVSAFHLSAACAEPDVVTDSTWRFPSDDWKIVSDSLRIWKNLPVAEEKVNAGRELWQTICMLIRRVSSSLLVGVVSDGK
ncbi:unnamed protein product [Peniophora sp. CBMAI 1063]|nr:unnamed protein product [Peniophora sp. CBMAI 1063]